MKITYFNPSIVTKNADEVVKLFEELGFKKRHQSHVLNSKGEKASGIRMKDENGFYVNVSQKDELEHDLTMIRVNVRDFDEAYQFLLSKGFKPAREDGSTTKTDSSEDTLMFSPSGFAICLSEHIRK